MSHRPTVRGETGTELRHRLALRCETRTGLSHTDLHGLNCATAFFLLITRYLFMFLVYENVPLPFNSHAPSYLSGV